MSKQSFFCMTYFSQKKFIIWLLEVVVLLLAIFNILPREAILFVVGIMLFFFIFNPIEDSLWLFVASIPLFTALPITEKFDYMASWRILLIVLLLILFIKSRNDFKNWVAKQNIKQCRLEYLVCIFLLLGGLSLFVAADVWVGVKKIIFLVNMLILFFIVKNIAEKNKQFIFELIKAIKISVASVLGFGFLQLISVFFIPLHIFWKFWSYKVIPVFYGQALGHLLSYSNTWFSYYAYQNPTLRMFSIFPDSHSFAMFCILSLPFFLMPILLRSANDKKKLIFTYLGLIVVLSAILFSGSRGVWVSGIGVFIVFLFFAFLSRLKKMRSRKNFFVAKFVQTKEWRQYIQLSLGCIVILILLLPISSRFLFLSNEIRANGEQTDIEKFFLLERAKSIIDFSETSVKSRLQIWRKTADSIMANPFLGVGIGNYPNVLQEDISSVKRGASAHNLYLDIASEMGIFALFVVLAVFWLIFKDTWTVFVHDKEPIIKYWAGFFILAFIWILGYSLFDVVLLNDKVFLFFMVNLGILYAQYHDTERKTSISFNKSFDA